MVAKDKIRIYDLARESVPESVVDAKAQKKIQTEITRRILESAPRFGSYPKTASSSIEANVAENLLKEIDIDSIVGEYGSSSSSSSSSAKASLASESPAAAPKRKLKIVRRISAPVDENAEEAKDETEASEETKEVESSSSPTESETSSETSTEETAIDPVEAAIEEAEEEMSAEAVLEEEAPELSETDEAINDLVKSVKANNKTMAPKNTVESRATKSIGDIQNVKSLSLNPAQNKPQQPYRVAAPTLRVQGKKGLGRTKKPVSPQEARLKKSKPKAEVVQDDEPKLFNVSNSMTVRELSHKIDIPETQIITYFFMKKIIKTVNDILEKDLIVEYLESQNYLVTTDEENSLKNEELTDTLKEDETEGNLITRPPVVTIMGHVDHGKTTLVDCLRNYQKKIVDSEFGGITQHISAYQVTTKDFDNNERIVTIIDTPGHEAFTSMRRRGANITDIVILIVAADDGVNQQTIECIQHIKESKVPFLVAVNKIDKEGANVDKVYGQLSEHEIIVDKYGGSIVSSEISALKILNIDDLLEKIILVADAELSEEIRSNPNRPAVGSVIEAEMSRHQGTLATILVQNGTLRIGDIIAAGAESGRVKAIFNENGEKKDSAGPSTPVKILGLSGVPKAGDPIKVYSSIQEAKKFADEEKHKELEDKRFKGISAFASEIKEGQAKELRVIIKADVQGSAEAIAAELNKLSTDEVLVKPIVFESGSITANDVTLAENTEALVIGFHVGTDSQTAKLAEKLGVKIKSYEIIYKLIEDIGKSVLGLHDPDLEEVDLGEAEIRKIFIIDKRKIAGSYVTSGELQRNQKAKVLRDGVQIYEGKLDYLKRFKDDVKSVKEGFECGISFERYNDLEEGDTIQCYTIKEIAKTEL